MYYNLDYNLNVCNQLLQKDIIINPDFLLVLKEYFAFYKNYPRKILTLPLKTTSFFCNPLKSYFPAMHLKKRV
jgi:hypothetical protein